MLVPRARRTLVVPVLLLSVLLAACGSTPASPTPTPAPSPTPSPSAPAADEAVVTIRVIGETYRIRLTDADDIAHARMLLAGGEGPRIPNGRVVRGDPDVNTGWSWHIDPGTFEWADTTIELCDGLPSFVEKGEVSGDRFCPWAATVIGVEAA